MRSAVTSPQAYRRQVEAYRSMDPTRRVEVAVQMSEDKWELAADGIRARHPDYDEEAVTWALRRMRLGEELFRQIWPDAPAVAL